MPYEMILVEKRGRVGLVTLNRPKALNALCDQMMSELSAALAALDADESVGAVVLTGSAKAFAAGADIKEIANLSYIEAYRQNFITAKWEAAAKLRKPIIAAVAGYALGGGCELAMMCDFILAADTARFGQPEITIGTIPGAGGSQRLTRAVGKAKAMEMILTGRNMDANEAERAGLVSRVLPADQLLDEAVKTAERIGSMSQPVAMMAKEVVNAAYETMLAEGLRFERRVFHATFALEDRKEGMAAFVENREAVWKEC